VIWSNSRGSFVESDLQVTASYGSLPTCCMRSSYFCGSFVTNTSCTSESPRESLRLVTGLNWNNLYCRFRNCVLVKLIRRRGLVEYYSDTNRLFKKTQSPFNITKALTKCASVHFTQGLNETSYFKAVKSRRQQLHWLFIHGLFHILQIVQFFWKLSLPFSVSLRQSTAIKKSFNLLSQASKMCFPTHLAWVFARQTHMSIFNDTYRVVSKHLAPSLYRSFSAQGPYN